MVKASHLQLGNSRSQGTHEPFIFCYRYNDDSHTVPKEAEVEKTNALMEMSTAILTGGKSHMSIPYHDLTKSSKLWKQANVVLTILLLWLPASVFDWMILRFRWFIVFIRCSWWSSGCVLWWADNKKFHVIRARPLLIHFSTLKGTGKSTQKTWNANNAK